MDTSSYRQPSKYHSTSKYGTSKYGGTELSINYTNHETEQEQPTVMDFKKIQSSYYKYISRNASKGNYTTGSQG